ncbi:MAG: SMC family ATPase [Chloroflexi bacterium]|nr:SMC family ATPase [Chloroflexota bacterium]
MIPLKLELTNFLSYRETAVLEFDGIHLACISGANGSGKSSILDGMTWVLFGNSRTKSDDDLVNRVSALDGASAEVRFTFDLEGSIYRITRRRRPRKSSMLELQIATEFGEKQQPKKWKTLSESKIRETQAAIETLLRMNYDTFINSSFLLQGKADEFTTKSPNRRKEILADLLGVSIWDNYRETAASRRKSEEGRIALLDAQTAEIEEELGEEADRAEKLAERQAASAQIATQLADKEALMQQLRRVETAVKQQTQMVKNLSGNLTRAQNTLTNLNKSHQQRMGEIAEHQALIADKKSIATQFAKWQQADTDLQAWQTKANEFNQQQQAKRAPELTIREEESRLKQRLQQLEAQQQRGEAATVEQTAVSEQATVNHKRLAEIGTALTDLAAKEAAWHDARTVLQQLQNERKLVAQEAEQLQKKATKMAQLVEEKTAVLKNTQQAEKELATATKQISELSSKNELYLKCSADADTLENQEQPILREQMNKRKARIDQLSAESGSNCPLCGQPLTEDHRKSVLAELRDEGKEMGDRFRQNKQRLADLREQVRQLKRELKERPRLEQREQTQRDRLARAQARLEEIAASLAEWDGEKARLAELEISLADESTIIAQQKQVALLETAVKQKSTLETDQKTSQKQLSQAEARLVEIERLLAEWQTEGQKSLHDVSQTLTNGTFAVAAKAEIKRLDAEIAAIGYDAAVHKSVQETRTSLADAPQKQQAVQQAEAAIKPLQTAVSDLNQQISDQTQTSADLTSQQEQAEAELAKLKEDGGDLRAVEADVYKLREAQIEANRHVGAAQQRLDVLGDLRARQQRITAERAELTQLVTRLKLLEKACGRNGVQALLIERALPDIEARANELLDRLTDGEMRIHFETQRKLKSRDALAETLDIRINDNAGERPYDNYSGGEQFRVNFAIRLALSQVLAKRAGARLQTLVIDEGFGSQDPNGRQRLVEAINTIQGDFARILVITHIDELRDAFQTKIEVEKTAIGSTIVVS